MIRKQPPVTTVSEETADFQKLNHITDKDYHVARKALAKAKAEAKPQLFLNYCFAVINQKNEEALSIRESAYAISEGQPAGLSKAIDAVIAEAIALRRHPANYKADHELGWANLVKRISGLRKTI